MADGLWQRQFAFGCHPLSPGRVALLGIAQRQIRIQFSQKTRKHDGAKPLPESIKTVGDWIQAKRIERNLTPGHLAAKMGIARALLCSWEADANQLSEQQVEDLARFFEAKPPKEVFCEGAFFMRF
jgi:ribosome-binding protein aMBF1 (putative translation factor)